MNKYSGTQIISLVTVLQQKDGKPDHFLLLGGDSRLSMTECYLALVRGPDKVRTALFSWKDIFTQLLKSR